MGSLVLRDVAKYFDGVAACSEINLTIAEGEFFTFLGPSGCGKTTLLRLIAGFIRPDKGSIYLGGRAITHLAAERREVGMVFQNYALFPFLTVFENIAYGLKIQKKSKAEIRRAVGMYMEMMGLDGFEMRRISQLSGGEQQRVALARSLATEPKVLLLDEPLSNLDARLRDTMRMEIHSLQKRLGITTLFVTHDQTEALALSDRVALFERGCCEQVGTPQEIYSQPDSAFVARFIGDTNLFAARISEGRATLSGGLIFRLGSSKRKGCFVSIRPQDISLSMIPPSGPNIFCGTLKESQLNGMWVTHSIEVAGHIFRAVVLNTRTGSLKMCPGASVFLSIPEASITVLMR